jgi:acyl dehydratase
MSEDPLHEALSALIGKASESGRKAADPVARSQIRLWLEAMGDDNRTYLEEDRAPRGMLTVFTNRGFKETAATNDDMGALTTSLLGCGLAPAGVGISQTYKGDIRVGDMMRETTQVESVSTRKKTRLGDGYFVTVRSDVYNQNEAVVGTQRITILAYPANALDGISLEASPASAAPPALPDLPGEAMPTAAIKLDRAGIIAACIACNDFAPAHQDPDLARARGFEDIFTDVYTGIGLAHRYVMDWAGPSALVDKIDVKLGASFYAGDTLKLAGAVTGREGSQATLAVRGVCRTGLHLDSMVKVTLG